MNVNVFKILKEDKKVTKDKGSEDTDLYKFAIEENSLKVYSPDKNKKFFEISLW